MALTFTTGMSSVSAMDSLTNVAAYKITAGGSTPTAVLETGLKKENTGCIGITPTASKDCGIVYDWYAAHSNAVLNLSTSGNEVLGVWILCLSNSVISNLSAGGVYIIIEGEVVRERWRCLPWWLGLLPDRYEEDSERYERKLDFGRPRQRLPHRRGYGGDVNNLPH